MTEVKHKFKFVPSICEPDGDKPADYVGSVTLRAPTCIERSGFTDVASIAEIMTVEELKKIREGGDEGKSLLRKFVAKKQVVMMQSIVESLPKFILESTIQRVDDGYTFSYDDMLYDSDLSGALQEMATKIIGKFRVGESTPSS